MKIDYARAAVECENSDCHWLAEFTISIWNNPKMILCEECLETLRSYCDIALDIASEDSK